MKRLLVCLMVCLLCTTSAWALETIEFDAVHVYTKTDCTEETGDPIEGTSSSWCLEAGTGVEKDFGGRCISHCYDVCGGLSWDGEIIDMNISGETGAGNLTCKCTGGSNCTSGTWEYTCDIPPCFGCNAPCTESDCLPSCEYYETGCQCPDPGSGEDCDQDCPAWPDCLGDCACNYFDCCPACDDWSPEASPPDWCGCDCEDCATCCCQHFCPYYWSGCSHL
jgi:hypothetical protein